MTTLEWRYMRGGRVRHALSDPTNALAVCGLGPWLNVYWFGTGSQEEYEQVAGLPPCKRCLAKVSG